MTDISSEGGIKPLELQTIMWLAEKCVSFSAAQEFMETHQYEYSGSSPEKIGGYYVVYYKYI